MLQVNPFPQNILAALDALAELGKAAQGKTKTERDVRFQTNDEKENVQAHNDVNDEKQSR